MIVAAPTYLEKAGSPKSPSDLASHKIILGPAGRGAQGWKFSKNGKALSVKVDSPVTVSVNEAATSAAVAGMGIITTSYWGCKAELETGQLIRLFPDWEIGQVSVHAVLAGGRQAKPSARAFTDYLVESFKQRS